MNASIQTKALLWGLAAVGTWTAIKAVLAQKRKIDFRDKTVLITGGSRGLGLELARLLAKEGANLAICSRDPDELDRAEEELTQLGVVVYTEVCDVTNKIQVEHFVENVRQALGPVDVLINNAGTIIVTPYEHATEDDFRYAMDTHFWATFYMTNAVLPHMLARTEQEGKSMPGTSMPGKSMPGRIVNITSIGGKVSVPHLMPYSTSKFAQVGYSAGLRAELQRKGIYVTTVSPGLMRTGSPRNAIFKGQHEKEYAAFKVSDSIPFLTMGSREAAREIIEACRYGEAERVISLPAKIGVALQGLAPNLVAETMAIVNSILPDPGGIGEKRALGKDSETALSESVLTTLTDQAADRNNEVVD
ncbi:SDR family NAD(P)-dependent oxidoreductase [Spirosoma radiotolerans]|uniref:Ketoacyl reductase n=1 Tax=Spirosoma radiotolerans TaxID=1379870 RepID=A0A0E3V851_9BACT|nr:SDR family oxidoreductase [Spirosoma radiotolerans]AKD56462.1 ketoacyl reductase [Spirosoma radiotolerans]